MIDLHAHILPGLDDGAASLAETVEIARDAAADGVTAIAATPHVRDDYPTTPAVMEEALAHARAAVEAAGVPVELLPGGELSLDWIARMPERAVRSFGLAGNRGFVLVEFPYHGWPLALSHHVSLLVACGIRPVLAHPERNPDVQSDPERLRPLVAQGALVQVTAASLAASRRSGTRATAHRLVDSGLAHLVASDAHGPAVRRHGLAEGRAAIRDVTLADWLTVDVPGAIVRGQELPERPAGKRSRPQRLRPRRL